MGKSSPKAPAPPDPNVTSKAQAKYNQQTALYNSALNSVNQSTPYGNLTYSLNQSTPTYDYDAFNKAMDGYTKAASAQNQYQYGGPENHNYGQNQSPLEAPKLTDYMKESGGLPQWTSKIELSPDQQKILDNQEALQQQAQGIGQTALGQYGENMANKYSYDGLPQVAGDGDLYGWQNQVADSLYSRLNPQFDRDQNALETRLANQGITQGSQAYNNEMDVLNRAKTDARNQVLLSSQQAASDLFDRSLKGRQQAIGEYDTQYNAPLNAYNALMGGVQVQNPQFNNGGTGAAAQTPDYQGAAQNAYQGALNNYNSQVSQQNSTMNSLFGLGGQLGAAAIKRSDERLKSDIRKIGKTPAGYGVYEYRYNWDPEGTVHTGVMAQEIEVDLPEAVFCDIDGYKMVDYSRVR